MYSYGESLLTFLATFPSVPLEYLPRRASDFRAAGRLHLSHIGFAVTSVHAQKASCILHASAISSPKLVLMSGSLMTWRYRWRCLSGLLVH